MRLRNALTALSVSGALLFTGGVPVQASESPTESVDFGSAVSLIKKVSPHESPSDHLNKQSQRSFAKQLSAKSENSSLRLSADSDAEVMKSEWSEQGQTTISLNPDHPVVYETGDSDGTVVGIGLPTELDLSDGSVVDSMVAFQDKANNVIVTSESVEGGTRIHTVLGDDKSPRAYSYKLNLPDGTTHHQYDDGSITFTGNDGEVISMLAPPWAKDAAGKDVPTEFSFSNGTLTQSIYPEQVPEVSYPIVADPYMGRKLFTSFNTNKRWSNDVVFSGTKTAWGQDIHNGSAGGAAGWIGGVAVGQGIMRNEGWAEWKVRFSSPTMTSKASLYQQYSCHVLGGFYNWAGEWNLERARSNNSGWGWNAAFHHCNW